MAIVEIAATLDGEADQGLSGLALSTSLTMDGGSDQSVTGVGVSTELSLAGSSTVANIVSLLVLGAGSAMAGSSGAGAESVANYAGDLELPGETFLSANAMNSMLAASSMAGASEFAVEPESDLNSIAAMVGNSALMIDPTKTAITGFSRGPQVPSTALPPTIPTIRVVPPAPPQASYSLSPTSNRNRRREE